jgi:hypothetical protein
VTDRPERLAELGIEELHAAGQVLLAILRSGLTETEETAPGYLAWRRHADAAMVALFGELAAELARREALAGREGERARLLSAEAAGHA